MNFYTHHLASIIINFLPFLYCYSYFHSFPQLRYSHFSTVPFCLRWNLYSWKCTNPTCRILTNRYACGVHDPIAVQSISLSRTFPHAPCQGIAYPNSPNVTTFLIFFVILDSFSKTSYKWSHSMCTLCVWPSFAQQSICEPLLVVCPRQLRPLVSQLCASLPNSAFSDFKLN